MSYENFFIWPESQIASVALLVLVLVTLLYLARAQSHKMILSVSHFLHKAFRLSSRSVRRGEERLRLRNREVLMSAGAEEMERKLDRNFHRINNVVTNDLQVYPSMHRSMSELITRIDDDYRKTAEVPPAPPEWVTAIEAVAAIQKADDGMVSSVLMDINKTMNRHQEKAVSQYRKASGQRHKLLKKMVPYWRKMAGTLDSTNKAVSGLLERSENIDSRMDEYEQILARTDKGERALSSSSLTQFFISGIVLLIALGGAIVNFNLIALPMSEMVGGGSYIGPFRMNNVAAMVIILLESATGIYLMEALRITRLFPVIGTMEDSKRRWFVWASVSILFIMASIEASLAFMRDIIAAKNMALLDTLAGNAAAAGGGELSWIPLVGQMVLGFILPFVLAFVAIPFESFVHSARTVFGLVLAWMLRILSFALRLMGNISLNLGKVFISLYDLLAFPYIRMEGILWARHPKQPKPAVGKEA